MQGKVKKKKKKCLFYDRHTSLNHQSKIVSSLPNPAWATLNVAGQALQTQVVLSCRPIGSSVDLKHQAEKEAFAYSDIMCCLNSHSPYPQKRSSRAGPCTTLHELFSTSSEFCFGFCLKFRFHV